MEDGHAAIGLADIVHGIAAAGLNPIAVQHKLHGLRVGLLKEDVNAQLAAEALELEAVVVIGEAHAVFLEFPGDGGNDAGKLPEALGAIAVLLGHGADAHEGAAKELMLGNHGGKVGLHPVKAGVGDAAGEVVFLQGGLDFWGRDGADGGNLHGCVADFCHPLQGIPEPGGILGEGAHSEELRGGDEGFHVNQSSFLWGLRIFAASIITQRLLERVPKFVYKFYIYF